MGSGLYRDLFGYLSFITLHPAPRVFGLLCEAVQATRILCQSDRAPSGREARSDHPQTGSPRVFGKLEQCNCHTRRRVLGRSSRRQGPSLDTILDGSNPVFLQLAVFSIFPCVDLATDVLGLL